jgi:hypothetical protein
VPRPSLSFSKTIHTEIVVLRDSRVRDDCIRLCVFPSELRQLDLDAR